MLMNLVSVTGSFGALVWIFQEGHLGIAAPRHIAVVRAELVEEISGEVREAADTRAKLRVMLLPHAGPKVRGASEGLDIVHSSPDPEDPGVA